MVMESGIIALIYHSASLIALMMREDIIIIFKLIF